MGSRGGSTLVTMYAVPGSILAIMVRDPAILVEVLFTSILNFSRLCTEIPKLERSMSPMWHSRSQVFCRAIHLCLQLVVWCDNARHRFRRIIGHARHDWRAGHAPAGDLAKTQGMTARVALDQHAVVATLKLLGHFQ